MERIKQALERARAERQGREIGKVAVVAERPKVQRQAVSPVAPINVTYTKTKIIKADPTRLQEKRVIASADNDAIADAYKVLRTQILKRMGSNSWNTLAITSPTQGNGKSLTSVNLAISMAREVNHTILLIDLDLRRPTISEYFGTEEEPGISDYLKNDVPLSDILVNPGIDRLVVLPGNESFAHSSEMLSAPKMVGLIEEMKLRYPSRLVLIDMPPLLVCDDVLAFSSYVDAVLLVVEEGKTREDELKRAVHLLEGTEICGIVLNKSREIGSSYGYDYGYSYGYGY